MPGPVFAATVVRGYESKNAGILIALGILGPPLVLREGPLPDPEEGQSR